MLIGILGTGFGVFVIGSIVRTILERPAPNRPVSTPAALVAPTPVPTSTVTTKKAAKNQRAMVSPTTAPTAGPNALSSRPDTPSAPTIRSRSSNYIRGPRGGCYYINGGGNKTYVERSLCN